MSEDRTSILEQRVKDLEERIEHLRFSRRVLMNLIEKIEKDKWDILAKLEKQNKKLQVNNSRYARTLLRKNRQIIEMETKLQKENTLST
ncbi:MAG TPA: translation initiation factor 2 [Desulfobacteria bacterium]|nr:translation initiation factor 2 [Desulfobacteria bacterium]